MVLTRLLELAKTVLRPMPSRTLLILIAMLYLSMSNDMGLYFLSIFQLPAEKMTLLILKKDHGSVLSVVEPHFHFIVATVRQVNAAGIVRNRNQGVPCCRYKPTSTILSCRTDPHIS